MSHVIVCGSINIDIVATVSRHPRPGETVFGSDLHYYPGGKGANQAVAAAKGGATVTMLGATGNDAFAARLRTFLTEAGVDTSHIADLSDVPTGTALILVDPAGQNEIAVVPGANGKVDEILATQLPLTKADVLVSQFEVPDQAIRAFFNSGSGIGATCILNPAPAKSIELDLLELVDVLVVNEPELGVLTGLNITESTSDNALSDALGTLAGRGLNGSAIVTLGPRGSLAMVGDRIIRTSGYAVEAIDTTGAGDCFVGSLAAELSRGETFDNALIHANMAGALCVTRHGAGPSMPTRQEVIDELSRVPIG